MKKHQILAAIGTLAVAANFILPGLAFGQQNQTGSVQINCSTGSGTASLIAAPAAVTFTAVNSPASGTASTVDQNAPNTGSNFSGGNTATGGITGTRVANDHLLRFRDTTSQGVNGCGDSNAWDITATITTLHSGTTPALTNVGDTDYIPASSMHIVTTTQTNTTNINNGAGPTIVTNNPNGVFYDDYTSTGNSHAANAPKPAQGTDFTTSGVTGGTYNTSVGSNTLDGSVEILRHCSGGENTDIYTGVAIDIDSGIHALQTSGNYTGTIQYTQGTVSC